MGNKFSDFLNTEINKSNVENFESKDNMSSNDFDEKNVKKLIDKYSGYNEEELMKELLIETNKQKANGTLNKDLTNFENIILPYLSDEQKQKMNDIFEKLK